MVLCVLVGVDGNVNAIESSAVSRMDPRNKQSLRVRLSKFKPAAKDAKEVEFWIAVEINFNLR